MVYSPLVDKIMPPTGRYKGAVKWSKRPAGVKINGLNVHHWAATNLSGLRRLVESNDPASANYLILDDGTLVGSVPEEFRAWTTSAYVNDDDKITVEIQNESAAPQWRVSAAALATLVRLYADIAKRHGFAPKRAAIKGHQEYGVATACPGPFLLSKLDDVAKRATALNGVVVPPKQTPPTKEKDMPRTPSQAVAWAKPSRRGFGGLCLQFCRLAYGINSKYGSAIAAWNASKRKHRTSSWRGIPVGAPVYFDKPSSKYGHIAIYVGGGKIATTHASTNRTGVDNISTWTGAYGYKMLGWTEDINDVKVISVRPPSTGGGSSSSGAKRKPHVIHTLRRGDRDDWAVSLWQAFLNAANRAGLKVDGDFGAATEWETREWQRKAKLVSDGVVGRKTWFRACYGIKPGSKGTRVKIGQRVMGFRGREVDGKFGPDTTERAEEVQRYVGVEADGHWGIDTISAMLKKD